MQGPFNLKQGGSGIAVRNPVYLEQEDGTETFWGFTIVIIQVPEGFEEAVDGLKGFGYHFCLSKTVAPWDSTLREVASSGTVSADAASYEFEIEGSHWKLEVSPADGWYSRIAFFLLLGVGLLIVLLIAGLEYILLVQSDYREMVRHNEELEKALTEAQAANRAKTFFLNNMSHDLRTPLNAILGYTKLLAQLQGMAEKADGHLQKIEESGEHLLSILNNMLDMARMESGEVHLDEEPYLIDSNMPLAGTYAKELERKHIRFTQEISVQHHHVVLDPWKVGQIYSNLLENAVQYTNEGGAISVTAEELPCEKDGYATYRLNVSDSGIGMSEAFQKHLFESFSRERNTTESKVIGTGLGLAIVKRLVDMMGGTITVESEPGKGSTFHVAITFQAEEEPEVPAEPEPVQPENTADVLQGKRILLAEDNALNAETAMEILEDMGLQTEWAEDGDICVDMLQKAAPGYYDLIIMDIQMPNMDGYEAARTIRAMADPEKAGIPIVALTANTFEEDRKKAFAAGMNAHLAKPIDIAKLEETLLSLLRG